MKNMTPNFTPASVDCNECPIKDRAVCAYCEKSEMALLEAMKSYKTYAAGDPIIFAGDRMVFVGSIVTGVARLSQTMVDGRKQMVGLLLPSDFVGRPGRAYSAFDVEATTDVTLCRFERKPFEKLLCDIPHLRERMLEMALDELDAAREWMLLLGRKTAREKIASLLTIIARRQNSTATVSKNDITFDLNLTREAMSEYLGLTLETVSRQINALKKDGVIRLEKKRHVHVKDFARLLAETGDDADGGFLA
jgi:CRP/FNR family transcriptional regulator, anaerobic regulatory protein